jgi:c-di-GMP-related signal transduction protein
VILELLETVEPEPVILEACKQLKAQGYRLVWDDFTGCAPNHPFLKLVEWVKVDFRLVVDEQKRKDLEGWLKQQGIRPLAEKVETQAEFRNAAAAGYDLFQGYFLARPEIVEGKRIPGNRLHYYQLLAKASADPLPMAEVEQLILRDVSLTYKLLHVVNSAAFNRRQAVHSIRDALLILGETQVRRWIVLLVMPMLALDKPEELTTQAVLRARICELLAERAQDGEAAFEAFLAGMMSLVEALTGRRFATLADELDLSDAVRQAVGERVGSLSRLLRVVESQEEGEWTEVDRVCGELGLPAQAVCEAWAESLRWYHRI